MIWTMVFIWCDNTELVEHVWLKIGIFGEKIQFLTALYQIPKTCQVKEIAPNVRTYFWVTILYKYNDIDKIPVGDSFSGPDASNVLGKNFINDTTLLM